MIVPTGVGAAIGGYAGDALPVARVLASVVDCFISHPNVMNAAMLYWPIPNALILGLQPVHQNKVGLVLDSGMEEELRIRHLQVADAARASLGLPVVEYILTDAPLEVEIWIDPACGKSTGRIGNPSSLLRAVDSLVKRSKVNAVAVVGRFPDDDIEGAEDYRQGKGVDVVAGVEAIISHLVVKEFQIPCAHAPALLPPPLTRSLSPKSAAEEQGPQYVVDRSRGTAEDARCILGSDVDSVVLPIDACGMKVSNYWEAVGVVAAHRAGVDPRALRRRGVDPIRCLSALQVPLSLSSFVVMSTLASSMFMDDVNRVVSN
ncbi:unnamed protein product [Spirodela intermedia]|uniref:Uncharacterized protein n=1 Tax=Spirodela intermedia TaxID=51605 RepID=A0A7I8JSS2_SPIIN|nr:unnamed protein product [Spirodela intermedia]CAA6673174.1 unnamed protein product [Spirodela intermedia]